MNLEELKKLSVDEKLNLIELIWDSLEADSIPISQAQKDELDRRLERDESGDAKYFSLEEVRKKIAKKREK